MDRACLHPRFARADKVAREFRIDARGAAGRGDIGKIGARGLDRPPMDVAIARVDRHPLRRIERAVGGPARRPPQSEAGGEEQEYDNGADPAQQPRDCGAPRARGLRRLSAPDCPRCHP